MYWTNLHALEKEIVEKRYSDKYAFNYFLGTAILYTLSEFLPFTEDEFILKLVAIPVLCITIIGSILSFKIYINNGGTDFFKDYFALNWVIGWRVFGLAIFSLFVLLILSSLFLANYNFHTFTPEKEPYWIAIILGYGTLHYYLLYKSFKRIAHGKYYKMNVK